MTDIAYGCCIANCLLISLNVNDWLILCFHTVGSSVSDFEDSRWKRERLKFNGKLFVYCFQVASYLH